jgi:hypothetical protein
MSDERMLIPVVRLLSGVVVMILTGVGDQALAQPPTLANPADPPARLHQELREVWRAGGDEDDTVLMGQIGTAISGPGGEVYALDSQLAQVLVFAADGRFLRTLGREGDGPGEFRQPTGLMLTHDGDLAVLQTFPGRLVYLDRQTGEPKGQWTMGRDDPQTGGFNIVLDARERGGVRAVAAGQTSFDTSTGTLHNVQFLALLTPDGHQRLRLAQHSTVHGRDRRERDELSDHYAGQRGLWDVDPAGHLYLVPYYDRYLIHVHGPDGELARAITREHVARLRTEAEKAQQRESMSMTVGGQTRTVEVKQQDRARSIERLQILDDGTLWVSNSHGAERWADDKQRTWDVYAPDGRLLREVTVTVPEGGEGNRLILLDDGRFLLVKGLDRLTITVGASSDGTASDLQTSQQPGDIPLALICYEVVR